MTSVPGLLTLSLEPVFNFGLLRGCIGTAFLNKWVRSVTGECHTDGTNITHWRTRIHTNPVSAGVSNSSVWGRVGGGGGGCARQCMLMCVRLKVGLPRLIIIFWSLTSLRGADNGELSWVNPSLAVSHFCPARNVAKSMGRSRPNGNPEIFILCSKCDNG